MISMEIVFYLSMYIIFWAMIGYPIFIKILEQIFKNKKLIKDNTKNPTVTLMIVAHNEEKVIKSKLQNAIKLDYNKDKLEILVTSDNSEDNTNKIVRKFIEENKEYNIKLYEVKERKGKTNAQNEAARLVKNEILVMTDANSMLEKNAIKELVYSFSSEKIAYVAGRLSYINKENDIANNENTYWNMDLAMRQIESNIQTITAGNGAIYACRTKDYYEFDPIECHDSAMPLYFALNNKRAIFNKDAIAYEKAGESAEDEFKRKVRMSRIVLKAMLPSIKVLNIFKYKWFTVFYLSHRSARYSLWLAHILLLLTNIILVFKSPIYIFMLLGQILIFLVIFIQHKVKLQNKVINMIYYYGITVLAQVIGVFNTIIGRSKPFWEKAESTR